ncbi:hypothetical protein [Peribacillus loiseleuriae]|uniref:Uncharacterized protein n=1 Tax=Peribacillus loiseleuriae TaxID=1679170 RepID=A0A0K9GSH5_9BACI|nr:hypothetical protein [Peribacillus loiseleuriae]KMY49639.1 hypothetical protein AC625_08885 [Peribacillus loiseleuriae]
MKNIGLIIQERRKQLNISQIGDILSLDIFNDSSEIVEKWQPGIDMFEDIEVSPDDIMLLKEFLTQVKQIR